MITSQVPAPRNLQAGIGRVDVSSGGRALSQAAAQASAQMNERRAVREGTAARQFALAKVGELEEQFRGDQGYTDFNERYGAAVQEAAREVAGQMGQRARDKFGASIYRLFEQSTLRMRDDAFAREGDDARATLTGTIETLLDEVTAGRLSMGEAMSQGSEDITSSREAGWISSVQSDAMMRAFGDELLDGRALRAIEENPDAALGSFEADGPFSSLGDRRLTELRSRARTAIGRREAVVREYQRDQAATARIGISDVRAILDAGGEPSADLVEGVMETLQLSGAEGTDEARDFRHLMIRAQAQGQARRMMPAERAQAIDEARQAASSSPDAARRLNALLAVEARAQAEVARNPIAWAAQMSDRQVAVLSPDAKVEDMAARRAFAETALGLTGRYQFFQPQELTATREYLERASAEQKLDYFARLGAATGPRARQVIGELGKQGVNGIAAMAELSLNEGTMNAAQMAARGFDVLRDNPDLRPKPSDADEIFSQHVGASLPDYLGHVRDGYRETADAIYAARAASLGVTEFNDRLYQQAVRDATGETVTGGGIGIHGGTSFVLPPELTEDHVNLLMKVMAEDGDYTSLSYLGGGLAHRKPDGELVAATKRDMRQLHLQTIQPGLYYVFKGKLGDGGKAMVDGKTGEDFILDLRNNAVIKGILDSDAARRKAERQQTSDAWERGVAAQRGGLGAL